MQLSTIKQKKTHSTTLRIQTSVPSKTLSWFAFQGPEERFVS